jgi:hypothetical protein
MAKGYTYKSYISLLKTLGKSIREVWQAVKKHPVFKFLHDRLIVAGIAAVDLSKTAAKAFTAATPGQSIGSIYSSVGGGFKLSMEVGFKFNFDFPNSSSSGKLGKNSVYIVINVDPNLTKSELREKIRESIYEWIEKNYDSDRADSQRLAYQIVGVTGV